MSRARSLLVLASLLGIAAGPALAQTSGTATPRITMEDARRIAGENGMTDIREIERDDGRWEVEGRNAQGRELEIKIDMQTGAVVKLEQD